MFSKFAQQDLLRSTVRKLLYNYVGGLSSSSSSGSSSSSSKQEARAHRLLSH